MHKNNTIWHIKKIVRRTEGIIKYWLFPLRARLLPRRFHAYCIGSVKSGTHSITGLFSPHYRAVHEPESDRVIDIILTAANGSISEREKIEFVKKRDKRLWLELESSHLNRYLLDVLVTEFPEAKFILTIRDCYSWLDSYINQKLFRDFGEHWQRLNKWRYKPEQLTYAKEEQVLLDHGLYTLDSYFSLWATHNKTVLNTVPPERLLIVRTHEIPQAIPKIAAFLDIPVENLEPSRSHLFKARDKFEVLSKIDRNFLEEKAYTHCKELMEQFFPKIWHSHWKNERMQY